MDTPADAGPMIQAMVDGIADQVTGLNQKGNRRIALNFMTAQMGNNVLYFVKVLCFKNCERNCIHVKIEVNLNNLNSQHKVLGIYYEKLVCDAINICTC